MMRLNRSRCALCMAAFVLSGCGGGQSIAPQLPATSGQSAGVNNPGVSQVVPVARPLRYTITDLGTLGGTFSFAQGVSDASSVAGPSTLAGDQAIHAFISRKGVITDLGTLGGTNSLSGTTPIDASDAVAGFSETVTQDPNGEDACGQGTGLECRAFLWRHGVMATLPTLGGNNALGAGINNRGQVIGTSETRKKLVNCQSLFLYHFLGFIWDKGHVTQLPPLAGDTDTLGASINDRGEAVGSSGGCVGGFGHATHSVLWRDGKLIDLGNLGGTDGNLPSAINNRGEVVGESQLAGGMTHHAFFWRRGVISDLGTLPGDTASTANSINTTGQVVGVSFDASGGQRGVLWQRGAIEDLNTLIPASSGLFVEEGNGINARGQIVGTAIVIATGEFHAYLATPTEGNVVEMRSLANRVPKFTPAKKMRRTLRAEGFRRYAYRLYGI